MEDIVVLPISQRWTIETKTLPLLIVRAVAYCHLNFRSVFNGTQRTIVGLKNTTSQSCPVRTTTLRRLFHETRVIILEMEKVGIVLIRRTVGGTSFLVPVLRFESWWFLFVSSEHVRSK